MSKKLIPKSQTGSKVTTYKPVLSELGNSAKNFLYSVGEIDTLPFSSGPEESSKIKAQSDTDFLNGINNFKNALKNSSYNFNTYIKSDTNKKLHSLDRPKSMY